MALDSGQTLRSEKYGCSRDFLPTSDHFLFGGQQRFSAMFRTLQLKQTEPTSAGQASASGEHRICAFEVECDLLILRGKYGSVHHLGLEGRVEATVDDQELVEHTQDTHDCCPNRFYRLAARERYKDRNGTRVKCLLGCSPEHRVFLLRQVRHL